MKKDRRSTMLECWRPPSMAGEPIGCLATTFTFDPGFFEEQCLSRFLSIDSHPDRNGLAYLLERENMLGATYAGVLIDHQQAGVDHSLRWDILPVRLPQNKCQHAKIALLAWARCIHIVIASANLTPSGYRNNQEVVGTLKFTPDCTDHSQLDACCLFLNHLIGYVPTIGDIDTVYQRARSFVTHIQQHAAPWASDNPRKKPFKPYLVFNLPEPGKTPSDIRTVLNGGRALDGCLDTCLRYGGAPSSIKVASPFFNQHENKDLPDEVTAQLCKRMARRVQRTLTFCVPELKTDQAATPRLAAPKSIKNSALRYVNRLFIETLPHADPDKNPRPWHAKMLWLENANYAALMIGSSNFTSPAMGLHTVNNAEANLLYITSQQAYAKQKGELAKCWPETIRIVDIDNIEWTGIQYELGEADIDQSPPLPQGFLAARFQAGEAPEISLHILPDKLPNHWQVHGGTKYTTLILNSGQYNQQKRPAVVRIPWKGQETPGKLLVQWQDQQTFWPVNVDNAHDLPMAREIAAMSVHDLIHILSAHDYSMAIRAWARRQTANPDDENLEDAVPAELDPLKRFRLQETFLHRIRTRARMLAGVRHNLQRPAYTEKVLRWRLEGIIGIKFLAEKIMAFTDNDSQKTIESVLELTDFFIMLNEVKYEHAPGAIEQAQFETIFQPFVHRLLETANVKIKQIQNQLPTGIRTFWTRTYNRCLH